MRTWWRDLDRLLRGEATRPEALRRGSVEVRPGGLLGASVLLGMLTGACMGCFALFTPGGPGLWQLVASVVKVPALFLLTLVVTFPSLYVFNALVGSRLTMGAMLRLLAAALGVMMAVLGSLGPIVAFFSASTTSYPFIVLFNVVVFGVSGLLGLAFLLQTLHRLSQAPPVPPAEALVIEMDESAEGEAKADAAPPSLGALDREEGQVLGHHVKLVFRCWVVLFGLVGAQMAWVLRPFVGAPNLPFSWLRPRESNFFLAVLQKIAELF